MSFAFCLAEEEMRERERERDRVLLKYTANDEKTIAETEKCTTPLFVYNTVLLTNKSWRPTEGQM